jgi:hypothetical protein
MADMIIIKDPEVVRDIERLAQQTGKSAPDAVAESVRAQLGQETTVQDRERRDAELRGILARIDALPA